MTPAALAAAAPNPLWYVTRGTAFVSLVLLTLGVAGGVLNAVRWRGDGWPRFVVQQLHRNGSLLALAFLTVHIVTAVVDPFAKLKVTDAVVPFTSAYRSLWLGLGVIAMELTVAVTVTSLLRGRLGFRAWRLVHWLAYLAWPVALVHGLGTGTDARTMWGLFLDAACITVVLAAVVWRVSEGWPRHPAIRGAGLAVASAGALAIGVWAAQGPLRPGWARAAGTPQQLLAAQGAATASTGSTGRRTPAPTPPPSLVVGLRDDLTGTSSQDSNGALRVSLDDRTNPVLHLVVVVQADDSAELTVTRSGATVCDVPAQVGRGVDAVCAGVEVRLGLQQTSDGSVVGRMTTGRTGE